MIKLFIIYNSEKLELHQRYYKYNQNKKKNTLRDVFDFFKIQDAINLLKKQIQLKTDQIRQQQIFFQQHNRLICK